MALRLDAVSLDVADAAASAAFWAALLDRDPVEEPGSILLPGDPTQVGLRFVTSAAEQTEPRRLHLHLTSGSPQEQERTVATVLELGGRHLDVGQEDDVPFVVMADPCGEPLCVIEAGNRYLAGTGVLGEVTCDGPRSVGLFWRDALGWPLVLDEGEQTAVQSPQGGTKISWDGWGAAPPPASPAEDHQRFDVVATDLVAETERLTALGTRRLGERGDRLVMTGPDGHAFHLRAG